MKLSDGVEQAVHCVTLLTGLGPGEVLSAAALAEFHGVSPSYLLKHLQALSRAGILTTVPGPRGGYRLGRAAQDITLLDVILAVEGPEPAFRCKEIRQRGPDPLPAKHFRRPCLINAAMLRAERAYRQELGRTTMAALVAELSDQRDAAVETRCRDFFTRTARSTSPIPVTRKANDDDSKT